MHDSWFRRCCLRSTELLTPIGLASEFVPDQEEQGLDRAATPSLDEVLAVRDAQGAERERWLSTVTPDELSAPAPVPTGRPIDLICAPQLMSGAQALAAQIGGTVRAQHQSVGHAP